MDWIYLFTSFNGRISRQPFWIGFGILVAVEIAVQRLASQAQGDTLGTILDLAFAYPEFTLGVKRSAWLMVRAFWSSICWRPMTDTDCAVSRIGVSVFVPTVLRLAT